MGGRIITMQRQARELGRLRTGYTSGKNPVRSETWIVTSHAIHYVEAAAQLWGGKVEQWQPLGSGPQQYRVITQAKTIDAILPPGDPLSQANELWSKGGCARRCDGVTEQLSDRPCLCLAQHGDNWHEQRKGTVCSPTTRLNVMLPELPDLGVWRVETHGYYAANEIAGQVDMLLSATGGNALVPVSLRIEPRQRVANGQTKKFPVIVVEVRGMTARQALAGQVPQIAVDGGQQAARPALEAPAGEPGEKAPDYMALATMARDPETVRNIWRNANAKGHMTPELSAQLQARVEALTKTQPAPEPVEEPVVEAEFADEDPSELWFQIVSIAGRLGWAMDRTEKEFAARNGGVMPGSAEAAQLRDFINYLKAVQQ